ncbi:MAG: helix-turn-helix domain-containing protein [Rhodospirillales bacterium]|nr:helix-turn-helix domain-containing protein [Rhodospirillales bacterium]
MARHIRAATLEDIDRPVIAVGNDYAAGHLHAAHAHRRSQLLFAETGTMLVETQQGSWMVPPHQAMWIPAAVRHSITMLSRVATRSVYLDRRAVRSMARHCQVMGVSPLLRQLLIEAVDLPAAYEPRSRAGRIMSLLLDEIRLAPVLPLSLPFPAEARLAARCRRFVERPSAQDTIDRWSRGLGLSRRSFTRQFRQETGLTFSAWQRRACLLSAVPRLLGGEAVTTIAFDLRYSSPAAFTTMFRNLVGTTPTAYRRAAS